MTELEKCMCGETWDCECCVFPQKPSHQDCDPGDCCDSKSHPESKETLLKRFFFFEC
jgi:hypothetical protein